MFRPALEEVLVKKDCKTPAGARRQRNTKEENKQIKAGNGKDLWNAEEGESEKEKKRKMHKNLTRMLMPDGRRNVVKITMVTRIKSKQTRRPNS